MGPKKHKNKKQPKPAAEHSKMSSAADAIRNHFNYEAEIKVLRQLYGKHVTTDVSNGKWHYKPQSGGAPSKEKKQKTNINDDTAVASAAASAAAVGPTPPDSPVSMSADAKHGIYVDKTLIPPDDAHLPASAAFFGSHGRYTSQLLTKLNVDDATVYSVYRHTDACGNKLRYVVLPDVQHESLTCRILRVIGDANDKFSHQPVLKHVHCILNLARLLLLHQGGGAGHITEAFAMDTITAAEQTSRLVVAIAKRLDALGKVLGYNSPNRFDTELTIVLGSISSYKQYSVIPRIRNLIESTIKYAAIVADQSGEEYPMPSLGTAVVKTENDGVTGQLASNMQISCKISNYELDFDRVLAYISKPHARIASMAHKLAEVCFDAFLAFGNHTQLPDRCRFHWEVMRHLTTQMMFLCERLRERCLEWNVPLTRSKQQAYQPKPSRTKSSKPGDETESEVSDDTDSDDVPS